MILFHSWEHLYIFIWHIFRHHQQQQSIGEGVRKAVELELCFCVSLFFNLLFENFLQSPSHFDYSHPSPLTPPTSMPLLYLPNLASFFILMYQVRFVLLYTLGCVTFHWSMVYLIGVTPLKEIESFSPSSYQLWTGLKLYTLLLKT